MIVKFGSTGDRAEVISLMIVKLGSTGDRA